jgi:hypothetical protein
MANDLTNTAEMPRAALVEVPEECGFASTREADQHEDKLPRYEGAVRTTGTFLLRRRPKQAYNLVCHGLYACGHCPGCRPAAQTATHHSLTAHHAAELLSQTAANKI